MKVVQFFVIGERGVGKSTLVDTYLWKLNFGYAYHDHHVDNRRYHIQLTEIRQIDELENAVNQNNCEIYIYLVCFKVSDRTSMEAARLKWLTEIHRLDQRAQVFLLGLQCDLHERMTAKLRHRLLGQSECLDLCRSSDTLHYLECSSLKTQSVRDVFDNILRVVLYTERKPDIYR